MNFKEFKTLMQDHAEKMFKDQEILFITNTDKDELWELYLDSFPEGTNDIFRKRREHDCSCCKHFIRSFGNVVAINKDYNITTIWDFKNAGTTYQPVIDKLSERIKSNIINNFFITHESFYGTDFNYEKLEDDTVHKWEHFRINLPARLVTRSHKTDDTLMSTYRSSKEVFKRSLEEISKYSIETVLDLISQKSLYKGEEWQSVLIKFLELHNEYHNISDDKKDNYCWKKSVEVGGAISKIKNHSIGVLLTDITKNVELDFAVRRYENIVAPSNYKRPKAIFSKKMIEQAQKTITELGLLDSLGRRFATIDDITVNNILFANRDSLKQIAGDVFSELQQESVINNNKQQFNKIEEVQIDDFIKNILPNVTDIELYLENKYSSNFMSVIAPENVDSKSMFKWDNNFSWAYSGNITDSMKENVKSLGGNVNGILRFSIQWNEKLNNQNDYDAHCIEPNQNHIWFENKGRQHPSSGMLDVDIINPGKQVAVENITWTDKKYMREGEYIFYVRNFDHCGGRDGFRAEIEYDGQIHSFEYNKDLKHKKSVEVARINFNKKTGITFIKSLTSTASSKIIWNLPTNQFHPVSLFMFSPNYWDYLQGIGNKHYLFILKDCQNEEQPNGFFNEFLQENLVTHKRVFEALGSKMRVKKSKEQLSGLGFSSTQRNSVICKVDGNFTRTLKLIF